MSYTLESQTRLSSPHALRATLDDADEAFFFPRGRLPDVSSSTFTTYYQRCEALYMDWAHPDRLHSAMMSVLQAMNAYLTGQRKPDPDDVVLRRVLAKCELAGPGNLRQRHWLWHGARSQGRALASYKGHLRQVPNILHIVLRDAPEDHKFRLSRTCDEPECVNPYHHVRQEGREELISRLVPAHLRGPEARSTTWRAECSKGHQLPVGITDSRYCSPCRRERDRRRRERFLAATGTQGTRMTAEEQRVRAAIEAIGT